VARTLPPPPDEPQAPMCLRCATALQTIGLLEFRVGGPPGGWHHILGDLVDLGERKLPLEVWACATCGLAEFHLPPRPAMADKSPPGPAG